MTSQTSAKVLSSRRRDARQKQALYQLLKSLNPPFGESQSSQYQPLSVWWTLGQPISTETPPYSVVDWSLMPVSCDPVALLDNKINTTRRKGVPVDQQVQMLQFETPVPAQHQPASACLTPVPPPTAVPVAPPVQVGPAEPPQQSVDDSVTSSIKPVVSRGQQKRWQVETFALVLAAMLGPEPLHVVDFGCGTGGLLLPLAHIFPKCMFIGVEMKRPALAILHQRAAMAGLTNVQGYHGMIEQYQGPLDVALALHACGNATDHVLLLAQRKRAAFIVSPCCVGKLKFSMEGGSSFSPHIRTWHALVPTTVPTLPTTNNSTSATTTTNNNNIHRDHTAMQGGLPVDSQTHLPTQLAVTPVSPDLQIINPGVPSSDCTGTADGRGGDQQAWLEGELSHPRSGAFHSALLAMSADPHRTFKLMASVADTNFIHAEQKQYQKPKKSPEPAGVADADDGQGEEEGEGQKNAEVAVDEVGCERLLEDNDGHVKGGADLEVIARLCKLHVELDRLQAARENGFRCGLFRVMQAGSTAKGDILVGVPEEQEVWHDSLKYFL